MNYNDYVFPLYLFQLMLGDNNLKGKEPMEHIVSVCPHIEILSLVGNKFESVDDMTPLVCYSILLHTWNDPLLFWWQRTIGGCRVGHLGALPD